MRGLVRYGPIPVVGLIWLALGVVDLVVGLIRSDGRTFVDLVSGARVITWVPYDEPAQGLAEALDTPR